MKTPRGTISTVTSLIFFLFIQFQSRAAIDTNALLTGLVQAIASNNVDQVKSILKLDPELVNAVNEYGNILDPALVLAAGRTNLALINLLLDAGAQVDKAGRYRFTALHQVLGPMLARPSLMAPTNSVTNGFDVRLGIARVLLDHGASIFIVPDYEQSLLQDANLSRNGDLVDFLLLNQRGDNPRDPDGNSLIHIASLWARTNALKELAQRDGDLEATNLAGLTPLQAVSRLSTNYEDRVGRAGLWGNLPALDADGSRFRDQIAQLLISLGARHDIFSAIALGWTNIAADILSQDTELARRQNAAGDTPLHWAAEFGETDIALLLLQAGSGIGPTNRQNLRPLDLAAAKGQNCMAEFLLAHGALVNRPDGTKSPLHWAAEQGNTTLLNLLLDAGAKVNADDEQKNTPLDLAVSGNHETEVKLLLAHHARFEAGTNAPTTPLHRATANRNTNLIELLLTHGANIDAHDADGKTPLFLAHEGNDFPLLEFLLACGANINARDNLGNTALHLRAAAETDLVTPPWPWNSFQLGADGRPIAHSMMEFLLDHGANANATNVAGETPLHVVAAKSFQNGDTNQQIPAWIQPLLNHRARLDAADANGHTPFQISVQHHNLPLAAAFLKIGAKINLRDKTGATALELLLKDDNVNFGNDGRKAWADWLLSHGANVNVADYSGATPLHLAVTNISMFGGYDAATDLVKDLLRSGAKVDAMDTRGDTPLILACRYRPQNDVAIVEDPPLPWDTNRAGLYWVESDIPGEPLIPRTLLANGANVNARDYEGNTSLHYAAMNLRGETVNLLLAFHAKRTANNNDGKTPLDLAYETAGGYRVIPFLQPPGVSGEIADAARRNDLPMVKAFLKDDPRSVNAPWLWESTPLQWACNEGHLGMVKLLLASGAKINPSHRYLGDVTRKEAFNRLVNCLVYYTNAQDAVNPETNQGAMPSELGPFLTASPLQLALANNHFEIARLLVKHGAIVDLASAASLGLTAFIQKAIKVEPNRVNEYAIRGSWAFHPNGNHTFRWNPALTVQSGSLLHFAVLGNQPKTVQYLLEAGADASMLDDEGRTPFQLATEMKLPEIIDLFNLYPKTNLR